MKTESSLEKLQDSVEKQLLSLNELRNVPILTCKQSNLASAVETHIKSGIGVAVIILPPLPTNVQPGLLGPVFNEVALDIEVVETVGMNRSGRTMLAIAEIIMRCIHMWVLDIADSHCTLELVHGLKPCTVEMERGTLSFTMHFVSQCNIR
jgi:hypothetical protein